MFADCLLACLFLDDFLFALVLHLAQLSVSEQPWPRARRFVRRQHRDQQIGKPCQCFAPESCLKHVELHVAAEGRSQNV